jgi:hypothetical protein
MPHIADETIRALRAEVQSVFDSSIAIDKFDAWARTRISKYVGCHEVRGDLLTEAWQHFERLHDDGESTAFKAAKRRIIREAVLRQLLTQKIGGVVDCIRRQHVLLLLRDPPADVMENRARRLAELVQALTPEEMRLTLLNFAHLAAGHDKIEAEVEAEHPTDPL